MKTFLTVILLLMPLGLTAMAGTKGLSEQKNFRDSWCQRMGGETTVLLKDKMTVDCLMDEYAVAIDSASQWAEIIGKSKYYAAMTGRKPGIVLILENQEKDFANMVRLLTAIKEDKGWVVWTVRAEDL
ncbi:MAG: hypothetical protein GY940_26595 [bacterium]|nr:hypothetical protein [bacterium]